MAYRFDSYDQALVIDGWEKGIADSPHNGIADMRNVNIVSIPGEASVNFSTAQISPVNPGTGTVTSANTGTDTITYNSLPLVEGRMAITFSATTMAGVSTNTVYWLGNVTTTTAKLYTDSGLNNLVDITGSGTGTFTFYVSTAQIRYFTTDSNNATYAIDTSGYVWSNCLVTGTNNYWIYTGNKPNNNSMGNGIVAYTASDGGIFVFAFSNGSVDFIKNPNQGTAWTYQWNLAAGSTGSWSATPTKRLKTANNVNNPHEAFVAPDNKVYYCDANWIGRFYETNPSSPFNPADSTTYIFDQTALLPTIDTAQCLTYLGTNVMVGGKRNIVYPWNTTDTTFNYPILIAENNIQKMVTVNTNTYIFVGNRGRIYVTNGSAAQLFKKVPDHISGTIEPYFTWGGACNTKNQLYFSFSVVTNAGTTNTQYGGVWAVDIDTSAIRLTNKLSYGTYAGLATALVANYQSDPNGTGLFIGWDSGATTYGVDTTSSNPYTGSQATIDTDLIPIGTFNKPRDFTQLEYRLTTPLVSGESITIKTRLVFNTQDTGYSSGWTDSYSSPGQFSNTNSIDFKQAQWVQFKVILNSTTSTPSYVRLKEIRIMGLVGPTLATSQTLGL